MKKTIIILIILILGLKTLYGQIKNTPDFDSQGVAYGSYGYYDLSQLFSKTYTAGTARMQAIGGAQISLGGDLSAGHFNPAGLGLFNSSSLSITPSLDFHSSEATYNGSQAKDYRANMNFAHLGAGFYHEGSGAFQGGTFAITLARINDFYNDSYYSGIANGSSIIDSYLDNAAGYDINQLNDELYNAYSQYLINPNLYNLGYWSFVDGTPRQSERIRTKGKQYQWDFSYGGNYNDQLYFGLGLGISTLEYWEERLYYETEFYDTNTETFDEELNALSTESILEVNGIGANATFGFIARPTDAFRIGLVAKTPTFYNLTDISSIDLQTEYNDVEHYDEFNDTTVVLSVMSDIYASESEYNLRTPWKLSLGASYFIGRSGFISADIDYLDYSTSHIKSYDYGVNFGVSPDNRTISNIYKPTLNYRIGGEYRLGILAFRAGYNRIGDPHRSGAVDRSVNRYSGGLGYRNENMHVDLSIVRSIHNDQKTLYYFPDGTGPAADLKNANTNISVTVGFNF